MSRSLDTILACLDPDPAIGLSIVDDTGNIRYANKRAHTLFLENPNAALEGRSLEDVYGKRWADERLRMFQRIIQTDTPVILRHIRNGKQLQSTIRPITPEPKTEPKPEPKPELTSSEPTPSTPAPTARSFLVFTVEGEYDPPDDDHFQVLESEITHLGPLKSLTRRELEVLALLGHGLSAKQIAKTLFRSQRTIESHVDRLKQKLGGVTRHQLVAFANEAHLNLNDATLPQA